MKLAFSKSTRSDEDQLRLFESFGPTGFAGLQLKLNQYSSYLDEPDRFVGEWGHLPGVASGLIVASRLDEAGVKQLRRVIRFAAGVGSDLVVYCLMEQRDGLSPSDIAGFARTLSETGRHALDQGTRLSLHNHHDSPVMHKEDFDVFFGAVEDGAVGLTLDTAHAVKSGIGDVAGLIRDMAGVIDNFHLKDYADGEWRVLGRGGINFGPIFEAVRGIGYDGWVSADEESDSDVLDGMAACFEFMRGGLASPGSASGGSCA